MSIFVLLYSFMWLLNLFKKKNDTPPGASGTYIPVEHKLLEQCIEFVPSHFRSSPDYAGAIEHISHHHYDKAVVCLINLADQPDIFFNDDYWLELKQVATKLKLDRSAAHCDKKLEENKINNIVLYKGIVIERVSEDTYKHYISDSLNNEKNEERRAKDGLKEMMAANGFYMKGQDREGTIYHINGKRVCEIRYQLLHNNKHLIVYLYSFEYLALPIRQRLSDAEKEALRKDLTDWMATQGLTVEFE